MGSSGLLDVRELNHPEARKRAVYAAFGSRDPRFDGQVFVGVSSTGIYCRTVCTAHMPKYENCTFFHTPAEAEAAGYRPCMTCRPEVAPGLSNVDASGSLARRAAVMLREDCASGDGLERLAAKLGYTGRHLRRVFIDEFGVTPVQYLQTCRLLMAKSLLTDSTLPVADVARASGFGSTRRLNHLFKERYRLTPTDLRKRARTSVPAEGITVRLGYRPPYRFDDLLSFFRMRALQGVEVIDERSYARTVRVAMPDGASACGWVRVIDDPQRNSLAVSMSDSLMPVISQVAARIRRQFDVDCDPAAVQAGIASLDEAAPGAAVPGTRLPGCFDPFETACRAVLGQQISVAAANKLAARIVEAYGHPIQTGIEGLTHAFPTPEDVLTLASVEDAFGGLGVIKTRSRVIRGLAEGLQTGDLDFGPGAVVAEQVERLLAMKGIGPWSANYIAMRVFGYPDAFLETDAGVRHALPDRTSRQIAALAQTWSPWRSYANICLWNALARS